MSMLARPVRRDADMRLFCLPYAGGSAQVFRPWAGYAPPARSVMSSKRPLPVLRYNAFLPI